jgi:hypothetical protein
MTQRILANAATAQGKKVVEAAFAVQAAINAVNELKATTDAMSYGSDNAAVQSETGIPLLQVPDYLSLLSATATAINVVILKEFVAKLEQG